MDFDFLSFENVEIDEWLLNRCAGHGYMNLLLYFIWYFT
jgi:hypothetical protein